MTMDKKKYDEVLAEFSISDDELQKISADFEAEMQAISSRSTSAAQTYALCTSSCTEAADTRSSRRRRSP